MVAAVTDVGDILCLLIRQETLHMSHMESQNLTLEGTGDHFVDTCSHGGGKQAQRGRDLSRVSW